MKKLSVLIWVLLFAHWVQGQTTLPTSWNFSTPGITTPPVGWTTGLGTNGNLTYAFGIGDAISARLDATGEFILIRFSDKPGPLSYYLSPQNAGAAWGGQFDVQESIDGVTWNTLRSITTKATTSTTYTGGKYSDVLNASSRYVRFYFTTKLPGGQPTPGGNMGLDSVLIQQSPAPPYPTLAVKYGTNALINGATHVIGNTSISTFTIENKGTADTLRIDSIRVRGEFADDYSFGSMPSIVYPNSSAGMALIFAPKSSGSRKASLTIYCNDSLRSPFVINLYGIGGSYATEPTSFPSSMLLKDLKSYALSFTFSYSGSKPEKFIVLKQKGTPITNVPLDGTNYGKGDYIGGAQVEKICDSIELLSPTFIHANSNYYFAVFSYNGPQGFENYNTSNYTALSVATPGKNYGTYYNTVDATKPDFISKLGSKINPHDTIYYSNYISRIVNPWLARDTTGGKKVVNCVYTNHAYQYAEPFLWANGSNGAVLTREHTWPQSWMPSNPGNPDWPNAPGTSKELPEFNDVHNLFPAHQANANARRSNNPFDEVLTPTYTSPTGFGVLGKDSANRTAYEPKPEHKGDVARALFYMAVCYHGINGLNWSIPANQNLALLREWNRQDPPDNYEIARHEFAASQQGNRNPFIDFPEWADRINFSNMTYIADTATNPKPVLNLFRPNAADKWAQGNAVLISWDAQYIDSLEILFSNDSLKTLQVINASIAASLDSFVYTIPTTFSSPVGIVILKDKKSPMADTSAYFLTSMVDGIESLENLDQWVLYPNPVNNQINGIPSLPSEAEYYIYNTLGELVQTEKINGKNTIGVESLLPGIFWVEIRSNKGVSRKMFVKN